MAARPQFVGVENMMSGERSNRHRAGRRGERVRSPRVTSRESIASRGAGADGGRSGHAVVGRRAIRALARAVDRAAAAGGTERARRASGTPDAGRSASDVIESPENTKEPMKKFVSLSTGVRI